MTEAAEGDMDAFEELVRRHQRGAFNVAYGMLSDEHLAADVAQEAFLRVLEQAETYRPTAKFTTYFYSILRRICIDHYRKKKPNYRPDFITSESGAATPPEMLERQENAEIIRNAISALPPRQRMALTLKHFGKMSYKDIAETMDCSTGAVDSLLIRAREKLKGLLKDL